MTQVKLNSRYDCVANSCHSNITWAVKTRVRTQFSIFYWPVVSDTFVKVFLYFYLLSNGRNGHEGR